MVEANSRSRKGGVNMVKKQKSFMLSKDNIKYLSMIKVDYDSKYSDTVNTILDYVRSHGTLTNELFTEKR